MQKMKKVRRQMTSNLTPAELDKIEAVARADIAVRVAPPTPGEPGRGLREVCEFLEVATSRNVLALVAEVRELRAKVERVRALHQPAETVDDGGATFDPTPCTCGHWDYTQCPDRRALGEGA